MFNARLYAAWAPGAPPFELASNIGTLLPKGAKLVMQIHYLPAGTTADPDVTRVQMRFTPKKPEYQMAMVLLGNFGGMDGNGDGLQPGPNDKNGTELPNPATDKDETHVGGEPCGFVIELENGYRIWHLGDTGVFGDMKLLGELYKPDLLLIPIGGGQFVMNPADAALATRELIKPKIAMPMHYATNPSLTGTPEEFIKALGNSPVRVNVMKPGDTLDL